MLSLMFWIVIAYFAVRGFLCSIYDVTSWCLRRSGINPDTHEPLDSEGQ